MPGASTFLALASLLASFAPSTLAHTWVEEYQVIGPNGSYIGDRGFSRGYTARTDPDFDGDANILWMLPQLDAVMPDGGVRLRVNASDSLCHPNQRTSNYIDPRYPKLKAAPGNFVAMKYLENGHVTLPWNQPGKPLEGGTVYVFGTTQPSDDEKIVDVMKWNKDGNGGDGRGWLLSAQNFDDGRCHQINDCVMSVERQTLFPNMIPDQDATAEQWCESDVQIPKNVQPGTLTTYWIWQWPTSPESECVYPDGKDEYYTTCADFEIVADSPGDVKIIDEVSTNTLVQENFQTNAVSTYMQRTAHATLPVTVQDWNMKVATTTQQARNESWAASCSAVLLAAQTAAAAGIVAPPPPSCPAGKWATGTLSAIVAESALAMAKTSDTVVPTAAPSAGASAPPIASGGPIESGKPGRRPHGSPGNGPGAAKPTGAGQIVTMTTYFTQTVTVRDGASGSSAPPAPSTTSDLPPVIPSIPAGGDAPGNGLATVMTVMNAVAPAVAPASLVASDCDGLPDASPTAVQRGLRAHARHFG